MKFILVSMFRGTPFGHRWSEFHFKGVCAGHTVDSIYIERSIIGNFDLNSSYYLELELLEIKAKSLYARLISVRPLESFKTDIF